MKRFLFLFVGLFFLLATISCKDETLISDSKTISINTNSSAEIELKAGGSAILNNELQLTFTGVGADSRCPIDVMCFWAGDAEVKLKLKKGALEKEFVLHTGLSPRSIVVDGYEIILSSVLPARKSNETIKPEDYSAMLKINYNNNSANKQVYFIDETTEWVLKKDMLAVNSAYIEKDELILSVSYSGGCRDHFIDLYAYKGIAKSIPPQMSLVLSHNANNDMCEAYATKTIKFNLNVIKEYLGSQVGVAGTVILNIAGTDGKPIKQSPVSYKY